MPLKAKIWLGRLFGWDKGGVRAILFLLAIFAVPLSAECAYNRLTADECDELCRAEVDDFLQKHAPEMSRTPAPFNPDKFIRDVLDE